MNDPDVRAQLHALHLELPRNGLVTWTSGNISARVGGGMLIKPSGVTFEDLTPEGMVLTDLEARVIGSDFSPSSDTATHAYIYRQLPEVGGIVHTHSPYATAWAATGSEIPCVLTAMADEFGGPIPCGGFALIGGEQIGAEVVQGAEKPPLARRDSQKSRGLHAGQVSASRSQSRRDGGGRGPHRVSGLSTGPGAWRTGAAHRPDVTSTPSTTAIKTCTVSAQRTRLETPDSAPSLVRLRLTTPLRPGSDRAGRGARFRNRRRIWTKVRPFRLKSSPKA